MRNQFNKRSKGVRLAFASLALGAVFCWTSGCGSSFDPNFSSNNSGAQNVATSSFTLGFQNTTPPAGVDSVQMVFRDSGGAIVAGPVETPITDPVVPAVPITATSVEIDYLRNGGFALFESVNNINLGIRAQGTSGVVDPTLQSAAASRSVWTAAINPAKFQVAVEGNPGRDTGLSTPADFKVKGVGYSPTPIGVDVELTPHLGDYFWDGGQDIPGAGILNDWKAVWQRDIENIRGRFNSARIYTMLDVHLNDNGTFPDFNNPNVRTHQAFLDAMWNNGDRPVYCLIGIPVSPAIYRNETSNQAEIEFWNENVARTVNQLKDHPAVLGFTIFNEAGDGSFWGGNAQRSQFYWNKIQELSKVASDAAPDKLVGFAYFDAPGDVTSANNANLLADFGDHIDFWGVNAAQAETLVGTLAPYRTLGGASKPVLFTELGNPATTHTDLSTCTGNTPSQSGVDSIATTTSSLQKAATALATVLPQAVNDDVCAGVFVFEWTDEYWKQKGVPGCFDSRGAAIQDGGTSAAIGAKANGFDDEEGYGLNGISLSRGRSASDIFRPFGTPAGALESNLNPDTLTPRQPLLDAVSSAFNPVR